MTDQALLVMDFQPVILGGVGGDDSPALAAAAKTVEAAREAGVPVVFVRIAFRKGYPELSATNAGTAPIGSYGDVFVESEASAAIHPALNATESDIVVTKRRVGPFASDLTQVLSGLGVNKIVLGGVSTSGVVLSGVRAAADADFEITVLSDVCADPDTEVHDVLINKVFPAQATVTTSSAWISSL